MIDRVLSQYETPSLLGKWNPAMKAAATLIVSLMLTVIFDPLTALVLLVLSILITRIFGRVPLLALLASLGPAVVLAVGLVWTNLLFARSTGEVWWRWGPLSLSHAGLVIGLALGLRVLCFASYSSMFLMTTDPSRFILSLIQDFRVPYQFGYAMLAVYRFLPMIASEYLLIRGAHRIRGVGEGRGLSGWFQRVFRYTIPLLASAIRRAERMAIAMEARGLGPGIQRTSYRRSPLRGRDFAAGAALVGMNALVMIVSWRLGILRMWHGQLY